MLGNLHKPNVILTHESDLDGLLSGVLLRRLAKALFAEEVLVEAYHYNYWRQRDMREKVAWVADFSFEARLDRPNWLIVDHHPTEVVPKNCTLLHDPTKSAALLCYGLCQEAGLGSPELDRLVHLSDVADLFLEMDPDFSLACDYANLVKSYGFWNLTAIINGRIESLLDHPLMEVMAVKRKVEDPIGLAWSRNNVTALSPQVGLVDTVVGNINSIVHQLLEQKLTPYSVLATVLRKNSGLVVASFRSRNGEAVKVAEKFQGGGHPNAAGAILPRSVRSQEDAAIYLKQILSPTLKRDSNLNSLESLFASIETK